MIEHKQGNLFSVTEHGCNAQGAGVALTVKLVFPDAFFVRIVRIECIDKKRELGKDPLGTSTYFPVNDKFVIINAITQEIRLQRSMCNE